MDGIVFREIDRKFFLRNDFYISDSCVFSVYSGSYAYNVVDNDSDINIIYVVVPPRWNLLGIEPFEEFVYEYNGLDITVLSISKYFNLLCQGDIQCVETLFVPRKFYRYKREEFDKVLRCARYFVTYNLYNSMFNYVESSLSEIKDSIVLSGEVDSYDYKSAYHCYRIAVMLWRLISMNYVEIYHPYPVNHKMIRQGKVPFTAFERLVNIFLDMIRNNEHKKDKAFKELDINFVNILLSDCILDFWLSEKDLIL